MVSFHFVMSKFPLAVQGGKAKSKTGRSREERGVSKEPTCSKNSSMKPFSMPTATSSSSSAISFPWTKTYTQTQKIRTRARATRTHRSAYVQAGSQREHQSIRGECDTHREEEVASFHLNTLKRSNKTQSIPTHNVIFNVS